MYRYPFAYWVHSGRFSALLRNAPGNYCAFKFIAHTRHCCRPHLFHSRTVVLSLSPLHT